MHYIISPRPAAGIKTDNVRHRLSDCQNCEPIRSKTRELGSGENMPMLCLKFCILAILLTFADPLTEAAARVKRNLAHPYSPKITSELKREVIGHVGNIASFTVETTNTLYFVTSFRWSFGGKALQQGSKYNISYPTFDKDNAVFKLTVQQLSQNDTGRYNLIVQTNIAPQAEDYVKLTVN